MTDPSFSIVVPTFHRPDALRETLAALLALEYPPSSYEVIIIDDGPDDSTADVIRELADGRVDVTLEAQQQRGAATARNRGARLAQGDWILFVDDDIVIKSDRLRRQGVTRAVHGDALVSGRWDFAPRLLAGLRTTPFGRFRIELEARFQDDAAGKPLRDGCLEMALVSSCNLAVRRELFWELGGFDEEFPVAGAEDHEFSLRARHAGCLLLLDTRIRCLHNDNHLGLRSYCAREERAAQTMPFLARKYPSQFDVTSYVRENRPISRDDQPRLVIKKLLKALLTKEPMLNSLHRLTELLEAVHLPERPLRRIYMALLGLHLFRGFRRTWA